MVICIDLGHVQGHTKRPRCLLDVERIQRRWGFLADVGSTLTGRMMVQVRHEVAVGVRVARGGPMRRRVGLRRMPAKVSGMRTLR